MSRCPIATRRPTPIRRPKAVWMRWLLASTASARPTRPGSSGVTGRDRGAHCGARGSPGRRPGRGRRPAGRSRCPGREHRHARRGRRAARVAGRVRAAAGCAGRGRRIDGGSGRAGAVARASSPRATVVELEARPVGDPELDERLARIETQFAERLAAKPDADEVAALATRLEASVDEHESLATPSRSSGCDSTR